jgi:hypothetical protein
MNEKRHDMQYPLDVSGAHGLLVSKYVGQSNRDLALSVELAKEVADWIAGELGYQVGVHLIHAIEYSRLAYFLIFRCEADAMLFRIRFGHLFHV